MSNNRHLLFILEQPSPTSDLTKSITGLREFASQCIGKQFETVHELLIFLPHMEAKTSTFHHCPVKTVYLQMLAICQIN